MYIVLLKCANAQNCLDVVGEVLKVLLYLTPFMLYIILIPRVSEFQITKYSKSCTISLNLPELTLLGSWWIELPLWFWKLLFLKSGWFYNKNHGWIFFFFHSILKLRHALHHCSITFSTVRTFLDGKTKDRETWINLQKFHVWRPLNCIYLYTNNMYLYSLLQLCS